MGAGRVATQDTRGGSPQLPSRLIGGGPLPILLMISRVLMPPSSTQESFRAWCHPSLPAYMKTLPPADDLLPPADQLIRAFDFESLLKAALEDEDLHEEEIIQSLLQPTEEGDDVDDVAVDHRTNDDSSEDEDTMNSNGKRPKAWKVRKKAKQRARAKRDV
ncbi:hypothetical protein H0H92_006833, partial [Tricholoma furcatifolium]